jgi:hypothetical protein
VDWKPVSWSPCEVEIAANPGAAEQPIAWTTCREGAVGCEQLVINEGIPNGSFRYILGSVNKTPTGYRVSVHMEWRGQDLQKQDERDVIYAESGAPSILFRTDKEDCKLLPATLEGDTVWMGAQHMSGEEVLGSSYIYGSHTDVALSPSVADTKAPAQSAVSSSNLLVLMSPDGKHHTIYDRVTNTATTFGGGPGFGLMSVHPTEEAVVATFDTQHDAWQGQIWIRGAQTFSPLLVPKDAVIPEIATDGATLVWIQTPPKSGTKEAYFPAGDLWTSPFAKTAVDLVPQKRRAAPVIGEGVGSKIKDGYYAFCGGPDNQVHVYRLSDMASWSLHMHDSGLCQGVDSIDSQYVFYHTGYGNYRRAIASLGAPSF